MQLGLCVCPYVGGMRACTRVCMGVGVCVCDSACVRGGYLSARSHFNILNSLWGILMNLLSRIFICV